MSASQSPRTRFAHSSLLLPVLLTLVGCGGGNSHETPEKLVPLSGTVLLDGAPVDGVAINFIPDEGTSGLGGYAVTDASGTFDAKHYSDAQGVPPGTYRITFSRMRLPTGEPIPSGLDAADIGAVETLPSHLTGADGRLPSELVTVTAATSEVTLEIDSKPSSRRS